MVLSVVTLGSGPRPSRQDGTWTGVRKTMTHTTAARHAPETASSLRLRSRAPSSVLRKKPLSRKNKRIPMELFTSFSVSEGAMLDEASERC